MPRPKSDAIPFAFTLNPATLAALKAIAAHHGWLSDRGEPNMSLAIRRLVATELARVEKTQRARENSAVGACHNHG